jgi:PAS domain S-box-containing protein
MGATSRIDELERELAVLRAELAVRPARQTNPDEDPAVARLLGDRSLLASLPDVIMILDRDHRVLYLNRVIPGRTVEEFIGKVVLDYLPETERDARREALERAWETGEIQTIESRSIGGNWWDNRLVPIEEGGRVAYMLTTSVDFTQRRRVEQALRESESRLRHAIDATGMGTWSSRVATQSIEWDEALCRIYGIELADAPTRYQDFLELVHPDDRAHFEAAISDSRVTGIYEDLEFRILRADGAVRHVLTKGSVALGEDGVPIGSYGGVFDVTDRKLLEAQLQQVQKMEAVGQLTSGIAHNFNNVLGVILPNVELCRRDASPALAARLDDIRHAAERGAELVRQLMIFARGDAAARKEPIDLAASARRTADICRTTFDRRIDVHLSIAADLPCALAHAGQIEQVLLNICLNARDAFEAARTAAPRIALHLDTTSSGSVRIRVVDNGPGMSESTRSRIFEPFFTTKDMHRGTGLGLASAYAIVSEHRGHIRCESRLGEGTVFEIELPSTETRAVRPVEADRDEAVGGSETLLLIEDEPLVRGAVRGLLALGGYDVLEAVDGSQGLATFERESGRVAAVIVDRLMPGLSGEEVLGRLRKLDETLPVLMLSGHPGRADRLGRASAVLAKPVSADTLLRTLRRLLDARVNEAR